MDAFDIGNAEAALDLATLGPVADPNPRVGCVVATANGHVAGVGYHRGSGTAHAEVVALTHAHRRNIDVAGGTAYVTLEPCTHTGRTGPCTEALLGAGIARVVVLHRDPGHASAGGVQQLRAAGVRVDVAGEVTDARDAVTECDADTLADIARRAGELVEPWDFAVRHGRPFVTWKFASTLDGRSAAADGTSRWITGEGARADVHARRARAGAIIAGTGTVLTDDPQLTVRRGPGGEPPVRQPLRVVVGERDLPPSARVLAHVDGAEPTLHLRSRDPRAVLAALHERRIRHAWFEGGPTLAAAFLGAGLVDEVVAYIAPALLGAGAAAVGDLGIGSITQIARFELRSVDRVGDDVRLVLGPRSRSAPSEVTERNPRARAARRIDAGDSDSIDTQRQEA